MNTMADRRMQQDRNHKKILSVYDWVGTLIVSIIILSLLLTYAFRIVGVHGDSMLPTLKDGDRLLLSAFDTEYRYGDIVVVDRYTEEPLIKRVIACGGQTIAIDENGNVVVDGCVLAEPYIMGETLRKDFVGERTIPDGYLFVMGDNRGISKDSRMKEVDLISEKDVVGKALYRVWPTESFGEI